MAQLDLNARTSSAPTAKEVWGWLSRGDVIMAVGVVGIIVLLIIPVPPVLLDLLLAISISSSVLILMTAILLKRPLDFTSFPTVLSFGAQCRLDPPDPRPRA